MPPGRRAGGGGYTSNGQYGESYYTIFGGSVHWQHFLPRTFHALSVVGRWLQVSLMQVSLKACFGLAN